MRVLFIVPTLQIGGAEIVLSQLLAELKKHGSYEIGLIVLTTGEGVDAADHCDDYVILDFKHKPFRALFQFLKFFLSFRPALVQGWLYHGNLFASILGLFGIPAVFSIHHSLTDISVEKRLTRFAITLNRYLSYLPFVKQVVFVSDKALGDHVAYGFQKTKSAVIKNGIDVDRFAFDEAARHHLRESLGIPRDAFVIGHFGRFHPVKDHSFLGQLMKKIQGAHPDCHYLLAGEGVVQDNAELRAMMPKALPKDKLHLLGRQSDIAGYFSVIDLFLLTSKAEAYPTVLLEAAAAGAQIISSNVGDAKKMLTDIGFVYEVKDIEAAYMLCDKCLSLGIKKSQDRNDALDYAKAHFSNDEMVTSYIDLYGKFSKIFNL